MRLILSFYYLPVLSLFTIFYSCTRESTTEPINDGIPPIPPSSLQVYYSTDGEVGIEWSKNNEPGIKGYNVYMSKNDSISFTFIHFTSSNYFKKNKLEYDTVYYFAVTAVDIFNEESGFSNIVSAQPKNYYIPGPPNRLTINARNWNDSISVYLTWYPPYDTDLLGYNIYRSMIQGFVVDSTNNIGFTKNNFFSDTSGLKILTEYYYIIKSVDKGFYHSRATNEISDIIHDAPELIFPSDKSELDYFSEFKFRSISLPTKYMIVVQRTPWVDVAAQKEFLSNIIKNEISVNLDMYYIEPYKTYFWLVATYSKSSDPNSISKMYSFTIIPD